MKGLWELRGRSYHFQLEIKATKKLGFRQGWGASGGEKNDVGGGNTGVWETGRYNPAWVWHGWHREDKTGGRPEKEGGARVRTIETSQGAAFCVMVGRGGFRVCASRKATVISMLLTRLIWHGYGDQTEATHRKSAGCVKPELPGICETRLCGRLDYIQKYISPAPCLWVRPYDLLWPTE